MGLKLVIDRSLRPHEDIDFFVSSAYTQRAIRVLESLNFTEYAGSVEQGDVFFQRDGIVVDLVPIVDSSDPPLTTGDLEGIAWSKGFLIPQEVVCSGKTFMTLTPEMHLEMKRTVAEFFRDELREKDRFDSEALRSYLKSVKNA